MLAGSSTLHVTLGVPPALQFKAFKDFLKFQTIEMISIVSMS
jgi:hypothetical protein